MSLSNDRRILAGQVALLPGKRLVQEMAATRLDLAVQGVALP